MTEIANYKPDYQLIDGETVDMNRESLDKARAFSNAERLARALGSSAPEPAPSESSLQYRKRLANNFQGLSPDWMAVDLRPLPKNTFERIEHKIYDDAVREAVSPTRLTIPPGKLVERITTDDTGRRIKNYFGDPEACWGAFKLPPKRVIGWNGGK